MSKPLIPFDRWESGTNQNSIPANDNSLRSEILGGSAVSDSVTSQPSLTSPDDDGLYYIIPYGATGSQWSTFTEDSTAIFYGGTWYEFTPFVGAIIGLEDGLVQYTGTGGWTAVTGGGGGGSNRSSVTALSTSGSVSVDYDAGDYFTLSLAGNVSGFTFNNMPGSGHGASLMIRITQDSTPRTVTWPSSFKWAGGAAPSVSTASGAVDVLAITTFDNGTTWRATLAKAFA